MADQNDAWSDRRQFLKRAAAASATVASIPLFNAAYGAQASSARNRPNIIVFMADDQGWADVSYRGAIEALRTPNFDAMAANGLEFSRFHAASPVCTPTRASVLTGRHAVRTGNYGLGSWLRNGEQTIAETLRDAGYVTGHFGKWHLGSPFAKSKRAHPDGHGFQEYFSCYNSTQDDKIDIPGTYEKNGVKLGFKHNGTVVASTTGDGDKVITDYALEFIERHAKKKQPFMAMVWTLSPHIPFSVSQKYLDRYSSVTNKYARSYFAMISLIDEQLGRIRARLRKLNIADNTLLWVCSDNGAWSKARYSHGFDIFSGTKGTVLEGGLAVPGVVEWPGTIAPGRKSHFLSCTTDIYPTILDVCGIAPAYQPPIDGVSLYPCFRQDCKSRSKPIRGYHSIDRDFDYDEGWYVIDNRYKLIELPDGKQELYDLVDDSFEKNNLINKKTGVAADLGKQLAAYKKAVEGAKNGNDYHVKPTAARHYPIASGAQKHTRISVHGRHASLDLPYGTRVRIAVFDLSGRQVAPAITRRLNRGTYRIALPLKRNIKGIFVLRAHFGERVEAIEKMWQLP